MSRAPFGPVLLAALDIDGTIVDHDERLSDRVRGAVGAVAASGVHVVVATGRSLHATIPILDRLGLQHGWTVCSNGAVLLRLDPELELGYEIAHARTFDPTPVLELVREYLPTALYAVEDVGRGYRLTAPFPDGELSGELEVVPFVDLLHRAATRVIVRSPEHTSQQFLDVTERMGLHGVNYAVGWTAWLDLAPDGVSKASALEIVRTTLEVPIEATLAVGDGRNDLEMFAWAGHSVAMGQSTPDVLGAADEITAGVDDDGLALVLESLVVTTASS
ncbi:MAG TPA: HAD family hydrolase [Kineosporiaceae bacterium]|nr:HAD family hydrolase [Kineosporiaceae bacterium]